jgi:hypothetical protein
MPIRIKIDVTKLDKSLFFKGKKGTYCELTIWENQQPDQYGNTHSVKQSLPKERRDAGEKEKFVGDGKAFGNRPQQRQAPPQRPKQADPDLDADDSGVPF